MAAPRKPKDVCKASWAEGLSRQAIIAAFGLEEASLEALVARFAREEPEPEEGDDDIADRWFGENPGEWDQLG